MQIDLKAGKLKLAVPAILLAFGMVAITLQQTEYFKVIPGDLGDARFNNVVLEHLFRWFTGMEKSLWSPDFFYPQPGTLAFSDNHFGTGPVYIMMRLLGCGPEGAYIGWCTVAPILNFIACYYTLRRLGLRITGSAIGAFIFTFALPVSSRSGHAQLAYRFAIPLAALALDRLLRSGATREFGKFCLFVAIQFYCSIYLGFFLLLLAAATFMAQCVFDHRRREIGASAYHSLREAIRSIFLGKDVFAAAMIVGASLALAAMFYPYAHYAKVYHLRRGMGEIRTMSPGWYDYLLADNSKLWGNLSAHIKNVPMRHEHQGFFGAAALLLALIGARTSRTRLSYTALGALLLLVILTLNVFNHAIYDPITKLPLANVIRSPSRITLVMLFPLAVLAGMGADWLRSANRTAVLRNHAFLGLVVVLMLTEYSAYTSTGNSIKGMEDRLRVLEAKLPQPLPDDAIVLVPASETEPLHLTEIDGMRLAQRVNRVTLNGYSGCFPMGYYEPAATASDTANNRLAAYASFANLDKAQFDALVRRVVVASDDGHACEPFTRLPHRTHFKGPLSPETIKQLQVSVDDLILRNGKLLATVSVKNMSKEKVACISDDRHPIRFSWRFVDSLAEQKPSGWNTRYDLNYDVEPLDSYQTMVEMITPKQPGEYCLEISMIQEKTNWFHEVGMPVGKSHQTVVVSQAGSIALQPRPNVASVQALRGPFLDDGTVRRAPASTAIPAR
jgi:hypothetical protein